MAKKAYDMEYFSDNNFDHWNSRNKAFFRKKQLRLVKGFFDFSKPVLDVGCASNPLNKALPELKVTATDLFYQEDNVIKADVYDLPFKKNSVEQIYCWCLLEHLKEPERALKELNRVLKQGGKILLSTEMPHPDFFSKDNTHIQPFTERHLREMFEKAGYNVLKVEREIFYFKGITYLPFEVSHLIGHTLDFLSSIIIIKAEKK